MEKSTIKDALSPFLDLIASDDFDCLSLWKDFCLLSAKFLRNGREDYYMYEKAAKKLSWNIKQVESCIHVLIVCYSELFKNPVVPKNICKSIFPFLEESYWNCVIETFEEFNRFSDVSFNQGQASITDFLPSYRDIEWRFDIQVATRYMYNRVDPIISVALKTEKVNNIDSSKAIEETHKLSMTPAQLKRVIDMLEEAIRARDGTLRRRMLIKKE